MSSAASLRSTCIQRTCCLLMSGVWDACEENPFSYMPLGVVQDLLSCMWTEESELMRQRIAHSRLLLTSGRLECVALSHEDDAEDYVTPLRMLSGGCQNLLTLSVRWEFYGGSKRSADAEQALREVLQRCPRLENLHTCIFLDPKDLRNCVNLKTLWLHFGYQETELFSLCITSDPLRRLRSVGELNFCLGDFGLSEEEDPRVTRAFLDSCPRLTSLGCLDSSRALKELHDRDLVTFGTPRRFDLRRCRWKFNGASSSASEYSERIRAAALCCPMVEALVIHVRYADALQHLHGLRNLTSLVINFGFCVDDYEKEVCSLLEEVGDRLRHLYVYGHESDPNFSLDVICENCPNLVTLKLRCPLIADEGVQPLVHLPHLERLNVRGCDRKCLLFLLPICLHLKVLCVRECRQFDDDALKAIIRKSPFAELEVACLDDCSLSEWGWREFLQSAPRMKSYYFYQFHLLDSDEAERCARDLKPAAHSLSGLFECENKQFPLDRSPCCSL